MAPPVGRFAGVRRCVRCSAFVDEGIVCADCRKVVGELSAVRSTVESLPLESLKVPRAYQRDERPRLVRQIIREFDPDLLGHLVVVRDHDGGHWLLDGQHRWLALVELGYETATCEVLHDVPLERQAGIFSGRNRRRIAPHPRDAFRSDHVARDPDVLVIVSILERYGYQVPFGKNQRGSADCFVCVSTLREVYTWGVLEPTVRLIRDTWPTDILATQAGIVAGLAACLRLYPEIQRPQLHRKLSRHSADEVLRLARVALANNRERRLWVHVAAVVVDLYNRSRTAPHRLDGPVIPYDAARRWKERTS